MTCYMILPPWIWLTMIDFDVTGLILIAVPLVQSSRSDPSGISLFSAAISCLIPQETKWIMNLVELHYIRLLLHFWMEDACRTLNGKTIEAIAEYWVIGSMFIVANVEK